VKNETPEQFAEAMNFANQSIPLSTTAEPNTCGGHYAALTGSPYAGPGPRGLETCPDTETYIQDLHQQLRESLARVAELEAQVAEIPDLLLIAHMQGAEQAKDQIQALRAQIEFLDCRLVGRVAERDRYREALRKLLPEQDPLDAEIVCDYCGATVPFDEAQNEHKEDCPWLMTYGTKEPTK